MNRIRVARLWMVDVRQSLRDPITALCLIGPVALALFVRFVLPGLAAAFPLHIDIAAYLPVFGASVALFPPMLYGMVAGFLMLDEKDEGTLWALLVTPLSRSALVLYRVVSPAVLAGLVGALVVPLTGTVNMPWPALLAAASLSAWSAPLYAFLLASLAGNKIEGLAVSKLLGILLAAPLASLVVPEPWQFALWPVPFYWPFRFILRASGGASVLELLGLWVGGVGVHAVILTLLAKKLLRYRG